MKTNSRNITILIIYCLTYVAALTYMHSTVANGESLRRLYLIFMYAITALCFSYIFMRKKLYITRVGALLFSLVCYEVIISATKDLIAFPRIFADGVAWPLLIITFYSFIRENELPKQMKPITIIGFALVCLETLRILLFRSYYNYGSAVFATYFCFAFLPLVYYFFSKKVSAVSSLIVALLMLFTLKRAAFIIVALGISFYYVETIHIQQISVKRIKKQIGLFILLILIALFGQYLIQKLGLDILNRLSSIAEDGGSGRVRIWELVFEEFKRSNTMERIFGHGFQSVYYKIKPFGISRFAHNSFLEMLYDYGYIGVSFIVIFVGTIIVLYIKMHKQMSLYAPIIGYTIVPMLILGSVSYFFEQSVIILPFCIVWGIGFGEQRKHEHSTTPL